jgi:hypothetical protein
LNGVCIKTRESGCRLLIYLLQLCWSSVVALLHLCCSSVAALLQLCCIEWCMHKNLLRVGLVYPSASTA